MRKALILFASLVLLVGAAHGAAEPARCGVPAPAAPNGRVLPRDLGRIDERALLLPGGRAALYALAEGPGAVRPERDALVLIYGLGGHPRDLQSVADRLRAAPYQPYVLVQDDWGRRTSENGRDLAAQLDALGRARPGRDLVLVAHSMGGIIARVALNLLAADPAAPLARFGRVELYALDTPWHGYSGPSDRGADRVRMAFARAFLPAGMWEMRAASDLFRGDPLSANPALRAGLLRAPLPAHVSVHLAFAADGTAVFDAGDDALGPLLQSLVTYYRDGTPVRGGDLLRNYWLALVSSQQYFPFQDAMRSLADAGRLDERAARRLLREHFPHLPGTHHGFLLEQPGRHTLLDHLAARLIPRG